MAYRDGHIHIPESSVYCKRICKAGISTALDETEESDRTKESIDGTEESDGDGTEESDGDGIEESNGTETDSTFDLESECENCEPEDSPELLENENMNSVIIITFVTILYT